MKNIKAAFLLIILVCMPVVANAERPANLIKDGYKIVTSVAEHNSSSFILVLQKGSSVFFCRVYSDGSHFGGCSRLRE